MTEMIYKTYRAEVKGVNADEGTIDMFIPVTSSEWDRDEEVVEPTSFKKTLPKFMKRPILVASHDYRELTSQIGEWLKFKIGDIGVEGKPKYYINEGNEQADWGFKLASKGMAAFSIGFIPKVWIDGDGIKEPRRTYKEVELLEVSQVIVPSNREAIQSIRSKGIDPITNKLFDDVLNDKEIIPNSTVTITIDKNTPLITKPETTENYHRVPVLSNPNALIEARDAGLITVKAFEQVTKPEETENFIHIPVNECQITATIDISKKEGISAKYCGKEKQIATYMFDKREPYNWTMARAKKWVADHSKEYIIGETTNTETDDVIIMAFKLPDIPQIYKDKTSQGEIIDEIDYLKTLIDKEGLSDKAKESFKDLIKRLPGNDIPVKDIKPKDELIVTQVPTWDDILASLHK